MNSLATDERPTLCTPTLATRRAGTGNFAETGMMIALLAVSSGYVAPLHRSGRLAHCGAARCGAGARASVVPTYDLDAPIFLDEAALLSAKGASTTSSPSSPSSPSSTSSTSSKHTVVLSV